MNYRELLIRYMAHIAHCEGIFFLSPGDIGAPFLPEEFEELCSLSAEADKLYLSSIAQR